MKTFLDLGLILYSENVDKPEYNQNNAIQV